MGSWNCGMVLGSREMGMGASCGVVLRNGGSRQKAGTGPWSCGPWGRAGGILGKTGEMYSM